MENDVLQRRRCPLARVYRGPNMYSNFSVDAERHRRTPRTPAIDGKMIESKTSADIGDIGTESGGTKCEKHVNITKKGTNIDAKS